MLLRCDAGFRLRIAARRMQSLKCAFILMAVARVTRLFAHFMHSQNFQNFFYQIFQYPHSTQTAGGVQLSISILFS